jgi:hypothetical protein
MLIEDEEPAVQGEFDDRRGVVPAALKQEGPDGAADAGGPSRLPSTRHVAAVAEPGSFRVGVQLDFADCLDRSENP